MSGPFEQDLYTPIEEFKHPFGGPENGSENPWPPVSVPQSPFDGVGFWYRPEPQDVYFHHHTANTVQAQPGNTEQNMPVKHRRTRSGCFTCRSRRVKCDETRPVCDRCKKGNRECVFPQPSSASKRLKEDSAGEQPVSPLDARRPSGTTLEPIQDISDEEELSASVLAQPTLSKTISGSSHSESKSRKHKHRQQASLSHKEKSPTPSDTGSHVSREPGSPGLVKPAAKEQYTARWSKLKPAEQDLLQFQHDYLTNYHYFLRLDQTDFVHDNLITIALTFEPLLNAVLAFAAYHKQMRLPQGDFKEFWRYYCRSITQLRRWLEDHGERNDAVILTILQLALFEEYLGDWANLVSHQRAAHSILMNLYNHETIMSSETSRIIFDWFTRFDIIASLMANIQTTMDRQWILSAVSWYQARYDKENIDTASALEYFHINLRLIGFDMACIFAGQSITGDFQQDSRSISKRLDDVRAEMEDLHESADSPEELSRRQSRDLEETPSAFDLHAPLFTNDLWPLNFIWLDWYGGQLMHLYQTAKIMHGQGSVGASFTSEQTITAMPPNDLSERLHQLALVQCQIYEAVERMSSAPAGAVLGGQIGMAFSTIFLRRDPQFTMWARRKLANVERLGYIWPATFRRSMAQLWSAEDIVDWWLPNGEGKPSLVDEIRVVVEDRTRENAEKGIDDGKDDLRDLKAIFDNLGLGIPTSLKIGNSNNNNNNNTTASGGGGGGGGVGQYPPTNVSDIEAGSGRDSPSETDQEA